MPFFWLISAHGNLITSSFNSVRNTSSVMIRKTKQDRFLPDKPQLYMTKHEHACNIAHNLKKRKPEYTGMTNTAAQGVKL